MDRSACRRTPSTSPAPCARAIAGNSTIPSARGRKYAGAISVTAAAK
nr:hypothetical protein [Phytohabitans rumicis]